MTATLDHRADQAAYDIQTSAVGAVPNFTDGGHDTAVTHGAAAAVGDNNSSDHPGSGTHVWGVAGPTPPAAIVDAALREVLPQEAPISPSTNGSSHPRVDASAGTTTTTSGHDRLVAQNPSAAGGSSSDTGHDRIVDHKIRAGVGSTSESGGHATDDTQRPVALTLGADSPEGQEGAEAQPSHAFRGPLLRDPILSLLAETVDDLERVRIASDNRYRQLTRNEDDSDGELRGLGLDDSVPSVKRARTVADGLGAIEHQAILNLQRQMRSHPLWSAWGKESKGVGEKQLARLLAAIGDPYWNDLHDRPRTVSELWAYCGLHVVDRQAPRKAKGSKVNWSQDGRMRAWNIAGACLKAQGHYADVYYAARERYSESVHPAECLRCGPKGKPAAPGSPLSDGHKHARALRIVAKTVLQDMWVTAKQLHEQPHE